MWKCINEVGNYRIVDANGGVVFRGKDVDTLLTHFAFALQREIEKGQAIASEIIQLEKWAEESVSGGWSTHQVDAMRKRADELRRVLFPPMQKIPVPQ